MSLTIAIITPERVLHESSAEAVSVPTTSGEITILPEHMALTSVLKPGALTIKLADSEQILAVSGGFVEVENNRVTILADTGERAEEIDEQRAEEARQRAAESLQNLQHHDHVEYAALASQLEKEVARLHVARRRKHRPHHTMDA